MLTIELGRLLGPYKFKMITGICYVNIVISASPTFQLSRVCRLNSQAPKPQGSEMRPIFCGNFEFDTRESELERLFRRYGKVDRVDMKAGFAFIYMEDERDADDAIRGLDRIDFGRKGRRLRVEWTKQERSVRKPEPSRKSSNSRPSKTLFVINFDPYNTRPRDLEKHFEPYGKILNVRIRKNFGFVQFESQEDATKALDATNMSKLMDRVISVEYAKRDDDERRSPDRGGGRDRRRSPSPYGRQRGSPDYGRGSSPSRRERASPDYGRGPSPAGRDRNYDNKTSPGRNGKDSRNSKYGRGSSISPRRERGSPRDYHHRRPSPSPASPRREREVSPKEDYRSSPNSKPQIRDSPEPRRSLSPLARERSRSPSRSRSQSPA